MKIQQDQYVQALKTHDRVLRETSNWIFGNGFVPLMPPALAGDILDLRFQTPELIEKAEGRK